MPEARPRGWHFRGYLPHFDDQETPQFITFRLADAIPADVIERWKQELNLMDLGTPASPHQYRAMRVLRNRIEKYLDSGYGTCLLRETVVATIVQNALRYFDGQRYLLDSWVIMPNHVHVLCRQISGWPLESVVQSWKSFTAHAVNKLLARTGTFWQADYFDRWIRDERHLFAVVRYIEHNPVTARLSKTPADWPWSSATGSADVPSAPTFPRDNDQESGDARNA